MNRLPNKVKLTASDIRKIRKPFTRKEFADMLQVTTQAIYWWETGRTKPGGAAGRLLLLLKGKLRARLILWLQKNS